MKKLLKTIPIFVLVLALLLSMAACGEDDTKTPVDDKPNVELPEEITLESEMFAETYREGEDEVAAYAYSMPKLIAPDDEKKAQSCEVFNTFFTEYYSNAIDTFMNTTYKTAYAEYNALAEGEVWGEGLYFSEIDYSPVESGNYIGLSLDYSISKGMLKKYVGYESFMFDKDSGKFITLADFTDKLDALKAELAPILLQQMAEQGMDEICYPGYENKIKSLEGAEVYFTEDGAIIVFTTGTVADMELFLLVGYDTFESFFNEYGKTLLAEYLA